MRPVLVFDADDTLWDEQGVLQRFEAAVEDLLDRRTGIRSNFRTRFIALENENIPALGYGLSSYVFSVAEAVASNALWYAHKQEVLDLVAGLMGAVQSACPEVIEGVPGTLEALQQKRYRMVLLTRGIEHEQRQKLDRSGLAGFFSEIRIVGRKDTETYLTTARELGNPSGDALVMIGNSMRSDVGPALAAGWRAIHVPAPTEWAHDTGEATDSTRFRRAERFGQVAELVQAADFWRS
jgi:putative hydrolase of the HAD superfamily